MQSQHSKYCNFFAQEAVERVARLREQVDAVCERGRSLVANATDDQHRDVMETAMQMLQEKVEVVGRAAESKKEQVEVRTDSINSASEVLLHLRCLNLVFVCVCRRPQPSTQLTSKRKTSS